MGEENGIGPAGYRSMDFDQVLETVGDSGAYQVTLFLLISVMEFVAIDSFAINFLAARMDHWCHVAELNNRSFDEQLMLAVPPRTADGVVATTGYSHCLRYDPISPTWNEFAEAAFNGSDNVTMSATVADRSTVRCDDGWTYDRSSFVSTIVSEVR